MSERQVWLDMAKGIGIVLVVIAHVADNSASPMGPLIFAGLSLFFMPLFFAISGFLYRPGDMQPFFWKKVRTLLVPYAVFLGTTIIAMMVVELLRGELPAPWQIRERMINAMLGGRYLAREIGVFWFVTALFFTQIAYNAVVVKTKVHGPTDPRLVVFVAVSVAIAYLVQAFWPDIRSPLAVAQVPLGIGAFWFGHLLRERGVAALPSLGFAAVVIAMAFVAREYGADFTFSMKKGIYGPPLLGLLLALALSLCILVVVRAIEDVRPTSKPLAALGQASLVIMFVHQFVHFSLRDMGINSDLVLVLLSIGLPYLLYVWLCGSEALSPWFLGRGDLSAGLRRVARVFEQRQP